LSCNSSKVDQNEGVSALLLPLLLSLTVLSADFISKFWIQSQLPLYFQIPVSSWGGIAFSITHATNRGAAWGMLAQYHTYLLAFRIACVAGLLGFLLFYNKNPSWRWPLSLIVAGAIGNIIDFFAYGHVVDLFQFVFWGYQYPIFNVADSAIFIGVAWLFLLSWKK